MLLLPSTKNRITNTKRKKSRRDERRWNSNSNSNNSINNNKYERRAFQIKIIFFVSMEASSNVEV